VEADRAVLQPRHVDADGVAALSVERLRRLARGDDLGAADAERPGERELGGAAADLGEAEEAAVGDVRDVLVVAEEAGRAHAEEGVADDLEGALAGELLPLAGGDAEEGPRLERLPEHDGLLGHHHRLDGLDHVDVLVELERAEGVEQDREVQREHHVVPHVLELRHRATSLCSLRSPPATHAACGAWPLPRPCPPPAWLKPWKRSAIISRSLRIRWAEAPAAETSPQRKCISPASVAASSARRAVAALSI